MSTVKFVQAKTTTLQAPIVSTETTSIVLKRLVDIYGNALALSDFGTIIYLTLEPGSDNEEIISATGFTVNDDDTVSLDTGIVRGLSAKYPYTTGGTARDHTAGSVVVVSNNPQLYASLVGLSGMQTIDGVKTFSANPLLSGNPTLALEAAPKQYVDSVVAGIATTVSLIVPGVAGETVAAGNLIYLKVSDGRWWLCDADTAGTVDNIILGISQGAGTAGNAVTNGILLQGMDGNQSGLSAHTKYYASNSAGAISSSVGTTEVTVGVSHPTDATKLYFYPRYDQEITEDQQDALVGAAGTPSVYNPFETTDDASSGVDQSQLTQDATSTVGEADATTKHAKLAQSFIAGKTSATGAVLHKVADTGSFNGTVTISLQADSAGTPSGSALATVTLSNATYLAIPTGKFAAIFSAAYAMVAGTTYWLVIETSTTDNSNHPNLGASSAGGYSNGSVKFKNTTDGWTAVTTIDLYFEILTTIVSKLLRKDSNGFNPGEFFADGGSTDAYYIVARGMTAYATGQKFRFTATTVNTGAATLNVNSLGAKTIKKSHDQDLATGDIEAGSVVEVVYDGTNMQMVSQIAAIIPLGLYASGVDTSRSAATASGNLVIPHGLGTTPKFIRITTLYGGGVASKGISVGVYNGTVVSVTYSTAENSANSGANNTNIVYVVVSDASPNIQTATVTMDATNITLAFTKGGTNGAETLAILWEAYA